MRFLPIAVFALLCFACTRTDNTSNAEPFPKSIPSTVPWWKGTAQLSHGSWFPWHLENVTGTMDGKAELERLIKNGPVFLYRGTGTATGSRLNVSPHMAGVAMTTTDVIIYDNRYILAWSEGDTGPTEWGREIVALQGCDIGWQQIGAQLKPVARFIYGLRWRATSNDPVKWIMGELTCVLDSPHPNYWKQWQPK